MSVATYTKAGVKATTAAKLEKSIFGLEVKNHQLLKDAYLAYLSNKRPNLAVAKTRGEVSGGGIKPWRQKGTGRARFGSSRNPIWRKGGAAFGPTGEENYTRKLNVTAKRLAIRQALSLAATEDRLKIVETIVFSGKVKPIVGLLNKIGAKKNVLLVVDNKDAKAEQSTNNLPDVKVVQAKYTNVFDLLNADSIVITKDALPIISDWLSADASVSAKSTTVQKAAADKGAKDE